MAQNPTPKGLALDRRMGESIRIGEITISVVSVRGCKVKLVIDAPKDMPIHRTELLPERRPH